MESRCGSFRVHDDRGCHGGGMMLRQAAGIHDLARDEHGGTGKDAPGVCQQPGVVGADEHPSARQRLAERLEKALGIDLFVGVPQVHAHVVRTERGNPHANDVGDGSREAETAECVD